MKLSIAILFWIAWTTELISGFVRPKPWPFVTKHQIRRTPLQATETTVENDKLQDQPPSTAVRAPLKFLGPYPCIGLRFPYLATASQRQRNVTGISLDFILDTAANTNTINGQVAKELGLPIVGEALPGLGAGGAIQGGSTFMLGDCALEGIEEQFTFMQNLTASALPVASPTAAGLLSVAFFHCFEGGVEFQWQRREGNPPAVTFYGESSDKILEGKTRVPITELPVTRLPSVRVNVNGVEMPALLDTGSPITVLNAKAAEQAGIATVRISGEEEKKGGNPLTNFANKLKESQSMAQAAARGDVLTIAGITGEHVDLLKSQSKATIEIVGTDNSGVNFGNSNVYVGNLPGLQALNAFGDEAPPAVVLGMDILQTRTMLFRARDKEVYF